MTIRTLIMGAAGRDFHNFNVFFRGNPDYKVVAFTATQIPNIEGRKYPAALAGSLYPEGIPIYSEDELPRLRQPGVRDQRNRPAAGHAALIQLHARRAGGIGGVDEFIHIPCTTSNPALKAKRACWSQARWRSIFWGTTARAYSPPRT